MNQVAHKAVVLLSGGLDSATCLAIARAEGFACYALSFAYGQRHAAELAAAKRVASAMGVSRHLVLPMALDLIGGSALTDMNIDVPHNAEMTEEIPVTYVPARNTVLLALLLAPYLRFVRGVVDSADLPLNVRKVVYSHPDLDHLANGYQFRSAEVLVRSRGR